MKTLRKVLYLRENIFLSHFHRLAFLDARSATLQCGLSVCPYAWNNYVTTGRISMQFVTFDESLQLAFRSGSFSKGFAFMCSSGTKISEYA